MPTETELTGRDLYLYREYPNTARGAKKGPIECFRVWDSERFMLSQVQAGSSKTLEPTERFVPHVATREQYLAQAERTRR